MKKKNLSRILIITLTVFLIGKLAFNYQVRDRHKGYGFYHKINTKEKGQIKVGFAALSITPNIIDTWNDMDGNAKYEPKKGDTFNDNNSNGKFDAYWVAGFHNQRPRMSSPAFEWLL